MSDNNGNLLKQQIYIPSQPMRWQQYDYDSLNRLNWAREVLDGGAEQWKQQFTYDRWGNRTINTGVTYGTGINNKTFTVNTTNNRLSVPNGQSGVMTYDAAGNLTNDTYTGAGNRTYDAENKITSTWGDNNQAQLYTYDAGGQRIKRTVYGVETWQVYGFGGELVAEYAANGAATNPQKEYGYRNGQLLITATGTGALTNFALNKTPTQSSTHASGAVAGRAVDGNTDGVFADGSVTHTNSDANAWWHVDLGLVQSISTIKVWNRVEFPERLTNFYVFVSDVPFTSTNLTTTLNQAGVSNYLTAGQGGFPTDLAINRTGRYVRVQLAGTNFLSLAEVQILGTTAPTNVALSKTATQSSTQSAGVPSRAVDGNTDGVYANSSVTHTSSELNAWWHVDLGQVETISTIKIWNRVEFPERLTNFYVFVSDVPFTSTNLTNTLNQAGVSSYQTTGQCGFPTEVVINRTGRYVRVQLAGTNYLSIAELQVWTGSSPPPVQWLISDHLGTPRMVVDPTGSVANMKRHDYLPFGEDLTTPTSGRSAAQGYAGGDGVRQQFTSKERDVETGADYFGARHYSSIQGRFKSVDPLVGSGRAMQPQSWNRYNYCANNPLNVIDPLGLDWWYLKSDDHPDPIWFDRDPGTDYARWTSTYDYVYCEAVGKCAVLNPRGNGYTPTTSVERGNLIFDILYGGEGGMLSVSSAEYDFLAGLGAGTNPLGLAVDYLNESRGIDTTSRDYIAGKVLGIGLLGGVTMAGNTFGAAGLVTIGSTGNGGRISWITPGSLAAEEEQAVLQTLRHIDDGTVPTGPTSTKWGWTFKNHDGTLPGPASAGGYREFRVAPATATAGAGTRRIVMSELDGAMYYSWTHYGNTGIPAFVRIR